MKEKFGGSGEQPKEWKKVESKVNTAEKAKQQAAIAKETEKKVEAKGLEKLLSSDTKIGEIIKHEDEIESFDDKDFSFEDKKQFSLFMKTVEKDEEFDKIFKNIKSYLTKSGELDLLDLEKVEALRKDTKNLSTIDKYIALTYLGSKFGVKIQKSETEKGKVWWVKPEKAGEIEFPDKISDFGVSSSPILNNVSNNTIKAFSLDDQYFFYDGETALQNPLENLNDTSNEQTHWMSPSYSLPNVVAFYLQKKGLLEKTNKKAVIKELEKRLEIDKVLVPALEATGFSEAEFKEILGVSDIFKEYKRIEHKIEKLVGGVKTGKKYLIKNGKTVFFENDGGPSANRGWDVRLSFSKVHIIGPDTDQTKKFEAYRKYEDVVGGKTYNYKEKEIKKILDFNETKEDYIVSYIDGKNQENSVTIKKEKNALSPEEQQKIIKEFLDKQFPKKNSERGSLSFTKYGERNFKTASYPHCDVNEIVKNNAYIARSEIIDADRYDELLVDGMQQGFIHGAQLRTEVYKLNLDTKKHELIASETSDRDGGSHTLSAVEHDGKIEFSMKPVIKLLSDGKIKVDIKQRDGSKWTDFTICEGSIK